MKSEACWGSTPIFWANCCTWALPKTWVSTGENKAIATGMVTQVLGSAQVQQLAQKMGVDPEQASAFIAKALPQVIDKLTPNGTIEAGGGSGA